MGYDGRSHVVNFLSKNLSTILEVTEQIFTDDRTVVIGKMNDLRKAGAIKSGERAFADSLDNKGYPQKNWKNNSSKLRQAMALGKPIRDASVNPETGQRENNTGFLWKEMSLKIKDGDMTLKLHIGIHQKVNEIKVEVIDDMFTFEPGPNRDLLGFKEEVLTAFNFLISEFGFRLVKAEVTFVRFESDNVFVNIFHGRGSYVLGFEIGLLPKNPGDYERNVTLSEIIELAGAQKETGYSFLQASTKERVEKYVPELAGLVKKYSKNALLGDCLTFKKLQEIQSQNSDKYFKDMELRRIRQKVDKAWHEKDYANVIKLFEPVKEDLTPTELKKLEYAKKRNV